MNLASAQDRDDIISVFEGFGEQSSVVDGVMKTRRPLVKSYMLETVPPHLKQPSLSDLFRRISCRLDPLDETMSRVFDEKRATYIGVVEKLYERHPVFFTTEDSKDSDSAMKRLVNANADLDRLWISAGVFAQLFQIVLGQVPHHRYGRLVFQHTSFFEVEDEAVASEETDPSTEVTTDTDEVIEPDTESASSDEEYVHEKRATKFSMVERLGELQRKLPKMQKIHDPLFAISQLRIPSQGKGGHDFFHHGKVTNRSRSFVEHRQQVAFVLSLYTMLTTQTENLAWEREEKTTFQTGGHSSDVVGAPIVLKFSKRLQESVFARFIKLTFGREDNRFRLWGNPIHLGPTKVHVYGVDRHIWQQIFLEITDSQITAILPRGTCGNSIHRLITNVQQYLDPAVTAWVGSVPYSQLIREQFAVKGGASDGKS